MVILQEKPIAMPRPFGGDAPTITISPRADGKTGKYITVQITGVIKSIYQYLDFMQILDSASKDDVIDVILDTPGGCVFTTQVLLERMNSSKATVTSVASGLVASAGTFLWFFSKHKKVDDWATFMFHSSSHGDYGKSLTIQETSTEMVKFMHKTIRALIDAGVLTAEEAAKIFRQKKDLFLPGSIIRSRMLQAMAATESIALRNEDGEYEDPNAGSPGEFENDRTTDPDGEVDEHANDDIDGETTSIDPEAIFKAEGISEGSGEGDPETQDPEDPDGTPSGRCGKKRKAKKRRRARAEGETETQEDETTGEETEETQGTGENQEGDVQGKRKGKKAKKAKKRRPRSEDDAEVTETEDGDVTTAPEGEEAEKPEDATSMTSWLKW